MGAEPMIWNFLLSGPHLLLNKGFQILGPGSNIASKMPQKRGTVLDHFSFS